MTIFIILLTSTIFTCYGIFAPFLPLEMENKGYSQSSTGYIIGIYNFANIIACITASNLVKKISRRNCIMLSFLLLSFSMLSFGFLMSYQISETVFVAIALILRVFQGLSVGYLNTFSLSLIG